MTPPRLATLLLEHVIAASERDAVIGDLLEEFAMHRVPAHGVERARIWYCWQVIRSLAPLFFRSWQRTSLFRASAAVIAAGLTATGPGIALLSIRRFVLQQVPLKTTSSLSAEFAALLFVVVLGAAAAAIVVAIAMLRAPARNRHWHLNPIRGFRWLQRRAR